MANVEPSTDQTVAANIRWYKCTDSDSPSRTRWFVELGSSGQWYLSLENKKWVFQPEQKGYNKFLLYHYQPSTPMEGFVVAQIQGEKYTVKDPICISTTLAKNLKATTLSRNLIKDWRLPEPRLFLARYLDTGNNLNPDLKVGTDFPNGLYTLESLVFPGYCIAYDSKDISPAATSIPVILVKKGDHNWDNRFLTFVGW